MDCHSQVQKGSSGNNHMSGITARSAAEGYHSVLGAQLAWMLKPVLSSASALARSAAHHSAELLNLLLMDILWTQAVLHDHNDAAIRSATSAGLCSLWEAKLQSRQQFA